MKKKTDIQVGDFTLNDIGRMVGELAEMEIRMDKLMAVMNKSLDDTRARYEEGIQMLRDNIDIRRVALSRWGELRKEQHFKEKRSIEFERGTVGFRMGTPKLKRLRKLSWDHIKANLINEGPLGYTRSHTEINKEKLIADREVLGEETLKKIGVKVDQDDAFFCEVKKDEPIKEA